MRIATFAAAAAFGFLGASQAFAGDASCIWMHLPQAEQDAAIADYQTAQVVDTSKLDVKAVGKAESACRVDEDAKAAAGQALAGIIEQTAAAKWLADNAQLPTDTLDKAWAAFDPKMKRSLSDAVKDGAIGKALAPALNAFETQLGRPVTPPTAVKRATPGYNLIIYILGRSQRAAFEPQF